MEFERGIRESLKRAALGFLIPVVVIGLYSILHLTCYEIHPIDRENDLRRLPFLILLPSTGLAILFGLSAYASFAPKQGVSFIRSLTVIAGATAIAVFSTPPKVNLKTVEQGSWVEIVFPMAVAIIATIAILIYSRWTSSCRLESDARERDNDPL